MGYIGMCDVRRLVQYDSTWKINISIKHVIILSDFQIVFINVCQCHNT